MTPPGALLDIKDGITSTSETSLREQAFPPLTKWPPSKLPWRPGNAFTPTTVVAVPETRLVTSSSPSRGAHEVHHSSSVSTQKRDGYLCMPRNIGLEHV
ncbi:Hypothetical protein FKW44_008091 [Caligus rogercresseyi]|uniref:Uncharacterized protein n=1 Tax=Caligus rogercresseyi TaxID=217165 RepID=A0A7T8KFN6_CALRO|nr:Hypothetical protein FKW44_008091 [Caligus rogercresseyi]